MNKKVVIVGAGKEGKGTFGDIFNEQNWQITFLDKDVQVIKALHNSDFYEVEALYVDHSEKHRISNYQAFLIQDNQAYQAQIIAADVIMLALYPDDIPNAANYLQPLLINRAHTNPKQKLTIVCGTNKNHLMRKIYHDFTNLMNEAQKNWFSQNVALSDMIVRRSSNSPHPSDLTLTTKVVQTSIIQAPVYFDLNQFPWFELTDSLEMLKDIKLYTYNCPHVTCAFAGYQKHYQTIEEAQEDPEISQLMNQCLAEAEAGILKQYPITKAALEKFVAAPKPLGEEAELISRVAFDPLRKLAPKDRLLGPAVICQNNQIYPHALIESIANGLLYDNPQDQNAVKMQKLIQEQGIAKATVTITGLKLEDKLNQAVVDSYNRKLKNAN